MSEQKQKEYIITEDELKRANTFFVVHGMSHLESRPHPAPAHEHRTYETCHKHYSCPDGEECWYWSEDYYWDCGNGAARVSEASQRAAKAEREEFQPLVDLIKVISTKRNEMQDLMRRNKIRIDNLDDPMQKLAFTFYSEIAEMAHKAEVVIDESTPQQAGEP